MGRAFVLVLAFLPATAFAGTGGEEDTMEINRFNGSDFEVVAGSFTATAEYFWCGAASFIERRSGLSSQTPIYIKRGVGQSSSRAGRKSVVFTTSDVGLPKADRGLTLSVSKPGTMMLSYKARQYCRDAFTRSTK